MNRECPVPLGATSTMTSASLDKESNTVEITIDIPDIRIFDITTSNPNLSESIAIALTDDIDTADDNDLIRLAIDNEASIAYIYRCSKPKRQHRIIITGHDLREAAADTASTGQKARRRVAMLVQSYGSKCPLRINDRTTLQQLTLSADTILYEYTVADRLSELEYDYDPFKDRIINQILHDPGMHEEVTTFRDAGYTLIFRYTSAYTHRSTDIPFSNLELHHILRKK